MGGILSGAMVIEKARIADVPILLRLIDASSKTGQVLPRSLNHLYGRIRDYWVARMEGEVLACCALHICWEDLAEIKSLVVHERMRRQGLGSRMVQTCLEEARSLEIPRVFVLTYLPVLFERLGFHQVDKETLPHKVWQECIHCPKFPHCEEIALTLEMGERRT